MSDDDAVGDFIDSQIEGMVTGYALFVTFIGTDGVTRYWGETMDGQTAQTTIGLAETMSAIEKERVVRHHFEDGDED